MYSLCGTFEGVPNAKTRGLGASNDFCYKAHMYTNKLEALTLAKKLCDDMYTAKVCCNLFQHIYTLHCKFALYTKSFIVQCLKNNEALILKLQSIF